MSARASLRELLSLSLVAAVVAVFVLTVSQSGGVISVFQGRTFSSKQALGASLRNAASKADTDYIWQLVFVQGVDVEAEDNMPGFDGWTAAHFAARIGSSSTIRALHELGADLEAISNNRKTPLDIAKQERRLGVVVELEKLVAQDRIAQVTADDRKGSIELRRQSMVMGMSVAGVVTIVVLVWLALLAWKWWMDEVKKDVDMLGATAELVNLRGGSGGRVAFHATVNELASGAFGRVVLGVNRSSSKLVAIKMRDLLPDLSTRDKERASSHFTDKVRSVRNLSHPNIVHLLGMFVAQHGLRLIFGMELMLGGNLQSALREARQGRGQVTPSMRDGWLRQLLDALCFAHRHGVVHRDVKPNNLLLSEDWRTLKLAGFGLLTDDIAVRASLVSTMPKLSTSSIMSDKAGTPQYMPPEVLNEGEWQPQGDVYSAGVVIFEVFTLVEPFRQRGMPQVITAVIHENKNVLDDALELAALEQGPPIELLMGQEALLRYCLAKYREQRPAAEDVLLALRGSARTISPEETLRRRRHFFEVGNTFLEQTQSGRRGKAALESAEDPAARREAHLEELGNTVLCAQAHLGSTSTDIASASSPAATIEEPAFADIAEDEFIASAESLWAEAATKEVVDAIVKSVRASLEGHLPALAATIKSFLGKLREESTRVTSATSKSQQLKGHAKYDSKCRVLLLFRVEKQDSVGSTKIPVFSSNRARVAVKCSFATARALNLTAEKELRQVELNQSKELLAGLGAQHEFSVSLTARFRGMLMNRRRRGGRA